MGDNNPKPDPTKTGLNIIENAGGASVPQTEVFQQPKYKPAQNLLEQLEYFKMQYKLKFSHILWIGLASYMCYDRFKAYQQYRDEKQYLFGKSRKIIQEKYGKLNQKYTQSTIHPRGDPDRGDWVYFQELPDKDQELFLNKKIEFQDKSSNFNSFIPLYITSGICYPFVAVLLGLVFRQKVFGSNLSNQDNLTKSATIQSQAITNENQSEINSNKVELNSNDNNSNELSSNYNINDNKENSQKSKFAFIKNFVNAFSYQYIYGIMTGFSIGSAIKIMKSFK